MKPIDDRHLESLFDRLDRLADGPLADDALADLEEAERQAIRDWLPARRLLVARSRLATAAAEESPAGAAARGDRIMDLIAAEPVPTRGGSPAWAADDGLPDAEGDAPPATVIPLDSRRPRARPFIGWAAAATVALALIGGTAWLLRPPAGPVSPADVVGAAADPEARASIQRALALVAPGGPAFRFEVLPPGAIAVAEGFLRADQVPHSQLGFGGYHRALTQGATLITDRGASLGLLADAVTRIEVRPDSHVHIEALTDPEKVLRVAAGVVVASVRHDESWPSTVALATPDLVARSVGTLYAVAFDADNVSVVDVGHGTVRVTDRNGRGLEQLVQGGERLTYHPDRDRFVVETLPRGRFEELTRAMPLPDADALAMRHGLGSLGDTAAASDAVRGLPDPATGARRPPREPSAPAPDTGERPRLVPPPGGDRGSPARDRRPAMPGDAPIVSRPPEDRAPSAQERRRPPTDPDHGLAALSEARRQQVRQFYDVVQGDMEAGNPDAAVDRLRLFLQGNSGPETERGWFLLGSAQQSIGRLKEAQEAYVRYLDHFPNGYWADEARRQLFENVRRLRGDEPAAPR